MLSVKYVLFEPVVITLPDTIKLPKILRLALNVLSVLADKLAKLAVPVLFIFAKLPVAAVIFLVVLTFPTSDKSPVVLLTVNSVVSKVLLIVLFNASASALTIVQLNC